MTNQEDVQVNRNKQLIEACIGKDGNRVALLLSEGADPNARDSYGVTAFMYGVSAPLNDRVVEGLIKAGADVNAKMEDTGVTVLMMAVAGGNAKNVALLLQTGADAGARDREGNNVLQKVRAMSSFRGKNDIVRLLMIAMKEIRERAAAGDSASDRLVGTVMPSHKSDKAVKHGESKTQKDRSH